MASTNSTNRNFYITFWLFAFTFLAMSLYGLLPGSFLVKAIPALIMTWVVWRSSTATVTRIMALGFVCSAAGDVFLDLDKEAFFVHGLASFLVAHLCYSFSFSRFFKFDMKKLWLFVALLAAVIALVFLMLPNLGELAIPVFAYIAVIFMMATLALFFNPTSWVLIAGALLFVLSDSLIAIDKFIVEFEGASLAIMITYFSAQFLIGKSWVDNHKRFA